MVRRAGSLTERQPWAAMGVSRRTWYRRVAHEEPIQNGSYTTFGNISGRYRQVAPDREVDYVEDKGCRCACPDHQRDQLLGVSRMTPEPVPAAERIAS